MSSCIHGRTLPVAGHEHLPEHMRHSDVARAMRSHQLLCGHIIVLTGADNACLDTVMLQPRSRTLTSDGRAKMRRPDCCSPRPGRLSISPRAVPGAGGKTPAKVRAPVQQNAAAFDRPDLGSGWFAQLSQGNFHADILQQRDRRRQCRVKTARAPPRSRVQGNAAGWFCRTAHQHRRHSMIAV